MSIVDSIAEPCRFVLPEPGAKGPERIARRVPGSRMRKRKWHEVEDERCRAAYEQVDARFRETLEDVLREDNDAVFRAATGFLLGDDDTSGTAHTGSGGEDGLRTALLVSGEASTNVNRLFGRVASNVIDADLVVLRPHECGSLRTAMRALTTSIVARGRKLKVPPRALTQEIRVLKAWSELRRVDEMRRPRIMVGIPNAESVSAGVLELLVDMLARIDCIDFRLLLNVATSLNDLNDIFTTRCCERVDARIFYLESGEVSTDLLVKRLLVDASRSPCFGPETFAQMLDDYQGVHRSADLLVDAMRYASLCHHYANPLSWLRLDTCPLQLTDEEYDWLRMLPSFRAHVEAKVEKARDPDKAAALLDDNKKMYEFVCRALDAIAQYRVRLSEAFGALGIMRDALYPEGPARRRNVDLYRVLLARGLRGHPYVDELLLRVKVIKPDVLKVCLDSIASLDVESELADQASWLLRRLEEIMEMADSAGTTAEGRSAELKKLDSFYRADDAKRGLTPRKEAAPRSEYEIRAARSTRGSAYSQKVIGEATREALTERQQAWTELVDEVHNLLAGIFSDLINHEHLPLHELFWLNTSSRCHEAAFRPDLRGGVRVALAEYEQYLGDDVPTVPETSAAFRLFQDSGQLINVFDWSQAFMQQYEDEQSDVDGSMEAAEEEEGADEDAKTRTRQALFMRSVAELKFLGLFKATRRKTDHVQKTVLML